MIREKIAIAVVDRKSPKILIKDIYPVEDKTNIKIGENEKIIKVIISEVK